MLCAMLPDVGQITRSNHNSQHSQEVAGGDWIRSQVRDVYIGWDRVTLLSDVVTGITIITVSVTHLYPHN